MHELLIKSISAGLAKVRSDFERCFLQEGEDALRVGCGHFSVRCGIVFSGFSHASPVDVCGYIGNDGCVPKVSVVDPFSGCVIAQGDGFSLELKKVENLPGSFVHDRQNQIVWIGGVFGNSRFSADSCMRLPGHINEGGKNGCGWKGCDQWRLPTQSECLVAKERGMFSDGGALANIAEEAYEDRLLISKDEGDSALLFMPRYPVGRCFIDPAEAPAEMERSSLTLVAPEAAWT